MVLHRLLSGTARFNELRRAVPNVTRRMLTRQLRELERDGVIHRQVYAEVPARVEYSLTAFGSSLGPILMAMSDWGERYHGLAGERVPAELDGSGDPGESLIARVHPGPK